MRRMEALKEFSYRGRRIEAGQEVLVDDEHVELFVKIGQAKIKRGRPTSGLKYQTRMMMAKR